MNKIETETIRRIYVEEGRCVEVGPDGDGLGVEIRTVGKDNVEWFGELRLAVSPEMAKALAEALIKCAEEFKETK